MVESKLLRFETSEDLNICPTTTVKGTVSFQGIGLACKNYVDGSTQTHISPVFADKWKIYLRIGQDGTRHVGLFLERNMPDSTRDWPSDDPYAWDVTMRVGKHIIKHHMFDVFRFDDSPDWGLKQFCTIDKLANDTRLQKIDVMELDFDVRGYPDDFGSRQALVLKPTIQTTLLQAYRLLFNDPNTADIQFVCTNASGKKPKYVYAHSAILSHLSEYFKTMFASGFLEALPSASSSSGSSQVGNTGSDDDDDTDDEDTDVTIPTGVVNAPEAPEAEEPVIVDNDTETSPPLEPKVDQVKAEEKKVDVTSPAVPAHRSYKIVKLTDTPYRTFRAMIYYLYTGTSAFAPLKSTYLAERALAVTEDRDNKFPSKLEYYESKATVTPLCDKGVAAWASAKSMYTLCDKFDIPELKKAAKLHIKDSLTPENIMPELFSAYAAKHDEIYDTELEYVKANWAEINFSPSFKDFVKNLFLHRSQDPRTHKTWLDILEASSY